MKARSWDALYYPSTLGCAGLPFSGIRGIFWICHAARVSVKFHTYFVQSTVTRMKLAGPSNHSHIRTRYYEEYGVFSPQCAGIAQLAPDRCN